jgi:hypothetical protein
MLSFVEGRHVHDVDSAKQFIRRYLGDASVHAGHSFDDHRHHYDLYLPWLVELVENAPRAERSQAERTQDDVAFPELERIFMEAAWELAQQGFLRPGPKRTCHMNVSDGYGKGFSLTYRGEEWVKAKMG